MSTSPRPGMVRPPRTPRPPQSTTHLAKGSPGGDRRRRRRQGRITRHRRHGRLPHTATPPRTISTSPHHTSPTANGHEHSPPSGVVGACGAGESLRTPGRTSSAAWHVKEAHRGGRGPVDNRSRRWGRRRSLPGEGGVSKGRGEVGRGAWGVSHLGERHLGAVVRRPGGLHAPRSESGPRLGPKVCPGRLTGAGQKALAAPTQRRARSRALIIVPHEAGTVNLPSNHEAHAASPPQAAHAARFSPKPLRRRQALAAPFRPFSGVFRVREGERGGSSPFSASFPGSLTTFARDNVLCVWLGCLSRSVGMFDPHGNARGWEDRSAVTGHDPPSKRGRLRG
jgi:hypothetical protein